MNLVFDDEYFMRQALLEANKAYDRGEIPVGAVVVCQNRIIVRSHNLTEALTDVTAHAEIQSVTAAANILGGKYLTECTLYVTLEPCPMCAGSLAWAQLHRLVYGASDVKRGYSLFSPNLLHPKTQVKSGVLSDECTQLMKNFFKEKR